MNPRILIATPVRGASPEAAYVTLGYSEATRRLSRDPNIDIAVTGFGCDLVRTRSRVVADMREYNGSHPDARFTHLLFWDDDLLVTDVSIIRRMLDTGHDCVAAPYPRKKVDWERVAAVEGGNAEARAYDYPVLLEGGSEARSGPDSCVAVSHIGTGFMLLTAAMLDTMWDHYATTLSFGDVIGQRRRHTVALFQLVLPRQDGGEALGPLLSEDYSFCERWRAIGGKIYMYIGAGAPLDHIGTHVFRGHREALVRG